MKRLTYLAGVIGLAVAIALVVDEGWSTIGSAIDHAGWALLWLLPFHVLPLLLDVLGWRVLLAPGDPRGLASTPMLFWIATIREASNRLLPVANIGGEIIGIRMVKWRGIDGAVAAASVIVETLFTLVNQYLFTALGIVLMIALTADTGVLSTTMIALVASLPLPVVLVFLLRHGDIFSRMEAFAEKLLGGRSRLTGLIGGVRLDTEIRLLFTQPLRLLVACAWQLLGFIVGSFESWLGLRLLGYPVSVWEAIAIEAVTQAVRHIIFIVPAGLGVQEGGLVLFGQMIGLPAEAAVALSLVKRMREVAFGVPALISWQWAEARRLREGWQHVASAELSRPRDL
jgi:putative membrane protein